MSPTTSTWVGLALPWRNAHQPAQPRLPRRSLVIGGVVALFATCVLRLIWKKEAAFVLTGHRWERRIETARFGPVRDTVWCGQVPSGGHELRSYRAVRGHEEVPDGETYTTREVDQGDGT